MAQLLVLDASGYATRRQTDAIPDDLGIVANQLLAQVQRLLIGLARLVRAADFLERHSQVMFGDRQMIVELQRTLPRQFGTHCARLLEGNERFVLVIATLMEDAQIVQATPQLHAQTFVLGLRE